MLRRHHALLAPPSASLTAGLRALALLAVLLLRAPSASASHVDGAIPVDSTTLPRLASVADVLVKVDKAYPYGDDHDKFKAFCERYVERADKTPRDFFIATVGVENYGDKHNQDLAKKLGAPDEDKYPQYYFLRKGTKDVSKATHFSGTDRSADALAAFVKRTAGINLGATGTLEEMDGIALDFAKEATGGKDAAKMDGLVEKAKAQAAKYTAEGDKATAEVYLKVMTKVTQKGGEYIQSETERVSRMLEEGKMSAAKKRLFEEKLRVLGSFIVNPDKGDEL